MSPRIYFEQELDLLKNKVTEMGERAEISYDRLMGVPSTSIITAKLGNDAGIIGAALLGK